MSTHLRENSGSKDKPNKRKEQGNISVGVAAYYDVVTSQYIAQCYKTWRLI